MNPTQLTIILASCAAILGVGGAVGVWVWASGHIRRLRLAINDFEHSFAIVQDRLNGFGDKLDKLQSDLSSSCEFLQGEFASQDKSIRTFLSDSLFQKEVSLNSITGQLQDLGREFHEAINLALTNIADLSESQNQTVQYMEKVTVDLREHLEASKMEFAQAMQSYDRESQNRDSELKNIISTLDDRLSNTLTTRFKQLTEKFTAVEGHTKVELEMAQKTFEKEISDFIRDTVNNLESMKSEVDKEISDTRAYIEDSLREHQRDLMV